MLTIGQVFKTQFKNGPSTCTQAKAAKNEAKTKKGQGGTCVLPIEKGGKPKSTKKWGM